jgi:hypothetical protein
MHTLSLRIHYGPDAAYPDADAAGAALDAFLQAAGLPAPARVDCGDGLEIFFPLIETVEVGAWRPTARALRVACKRAGLAADHRVTVDPRSLWRVPGTTNRDVDPPTEIVVTTLGDGGHALADLHDRLRRKQGRVR